MNISTNEIINIIKNRKDKKFPCGEKFNLNPHLGQ